MNTAELREAYLSFFESKGHRRMPSSTLVPQDDPTLLFTNAGMVQFKDPLLGRSDLGFGRATSAQRCVRAGGKHNDLENVGYTARHHTFFEMMGNFSFGDYFKDETIAWAWEFVSEVVKLPKEKIWVTVHPTDDEARRIWIEDIGIAPERVVDIEDNFWTMGDTGPCGPCTELFYDHGPEVEGGPPGTPEEDGDRYIEFWNLVFPQFDRAADGTLTPLPQPGVDTGMGLERMAAILQHVHSNYEIDLFANLMKAAGHYASITDETEVLNNASLRVIADHIRSSVFLIADGVTPGNEDRAYVLRRIIRRALRHGYKLDIKDLFFHKLVGVLVEEMGEAYPILRQEQQRIEQVLLAEEERFSETLSQGMELLQKQLDGLEGTVIPGEVVFQLYDTYGFPADLTADLARERELSVDMDGFEVAMEAQRERGRAATSFSTSLSQRISADSEVRFLGYEQTDAQAQVLGLYDLEGETRPSLAQGEAGVVVLDQTPFYAESGGQVGDHGVLRTSAGVFAVSDTLISGDQYIHIGEMREGQLAANDAVAAEVDESKRDRTRRNHSATHLLHAALREVLGVHVQQKGSLVNSDKLRFDFSHPEAVSADELAVIEARVNAEIRRNTPVDTGLMNYNEAIEAGAMALFGEKYGDEVRVLTMGEGYSVELCGGTHVMRTGDIGLFKIDSESGVAAGIRRIEAVTGEGAMDLVNARQHTMSELTGLLKSADSDLVNRVQALLDDNKALQRKMNELQQKLAADQGSDLMSAVVDVGTTKFLGARVEGDMKSMLQTLDTVRSQLSSAVVVLACVHGDKVNMVVSVSKDLTDLVQAPELLNAIGHHAGVKGGGRTDMARAGGGTNPPGLDDAFAAADAFLRERLG